MDTLKLLQRLRLSIRKYHLFLLFFAAGIVAVVFGMTIYFKKLSHAPGALLLNERACNNKQVILYLNSPESFSSPQVCLPIQPIRTFEDISFLDIEFQAKRWKLTALQVESVGDLVAEFSMNAANGFPLIAVVQDFSGAEYLLAWNENAQISLSSIKNLITRGLFCRKNDHFARVEIPDFQKMDSNPSFIYILLK